MAIELKFEHIKGQTQSIESNYNWKSNGCTQTKNKKQISILGSSTKLGTTKDHNHIPHNHRTSDRLLWPIDFQSLFEDLWPITFVPIGYNHSHHHYPLILPNNKRHHRQSILAVLPCLNYQMSLPNLLQSIFVDQTSLEYKNKLF